MCARPWKASTPRILSGRSRPASSMQRSTSLRPRRRPAWRPSSTCRSARRTGGRPAIRAATRFIAEAGPQLVRASTSSICGRPTSWSGCCTRGSCPTCSRASCGCPSVRAGIRRSPRTIRAASSRRCCTNPDGAHRHHHPDLRTGRDGPRTDGGRTLRGAGQHDRLPGPPGRGVLQSHCGTWAFRPTSSSISAAPWIDYQTRSHVRR